MNEPLWIWITFNAFIIFLLAIDLFVLHQKDKVISLKEALINSSMWIAIALLFNLGIYVFLGKEDALNFLTGYLIEKALSIDNLFIFILIFKYFHTPKQYQHKVLFWGIIGAIIVRAVFIVFGVSIVSAFHWVLYLFGAFLVFTGIKMALPQNEEVHPENNPLVNLAKKWTSVTDEYHGNKFFIKKKGQWWATPLFLTLLTIESTDVIFAVDSIPAIMAITLNPFIIYSSNIFAILGLRSLYFALAHLMSLFNYLNYGLAAILIFIGMKMLIEPFIIIPIFFSLGFIIVAIGIAITASIINPNQKKQ
ncbi:MAG: TerC family protein [Parachlamydiaceae bacterium]|nr:TerC family protein [Parachlamydiaceae bacterium]